MQNCKKSHVIVRNNYFKAKNFTKKYMYFDL